MKNLESHIGFISKFRLKELIIKEMKYWLFSLRPEQPTLGSFVISLKRPCEKMSNLYPEETEELAKVFKLIETILERTFKPDKINYLALMMVDHQVHFHVIPRYKEVRIFNETEYKDHTWPMLPSFNANSINDKELFEIHEFCRINAI